MLIFFLWLPLTDPPALVRDVLPRNSSCSDWGHMKVTIPWNHNPILPLTHFLHGHISTLWHFTSSNSLGCKSVAYEIYYHWILDKSFRVYKPGELDTREWQPGQGWFHGALKWEWTSWYQWRPNKRLYCHFLGNFTPVCFLPTNLEALSFHFFFIRAMERLFWGKFVLPFLAMKAKEKWVKQELALTGV